MEPHHDYTVSQGPFSFSMPYVATDLYQAIDTQPLLPWQDLAASP